MAYSEEVKSEVMKRYLDGDSQSKLSKELGIPQGTISQWLKNNGIKGQKGVPVKIKHVDFFDTIDSEVKAYFLGWLMADGNINLTDKQAFLKIHVPLKSRELIDGFLTWIGSTNTVTIKNKNRSPYCVASLSSVHMINRLIELGFTDNKKETASIPSMRNELIPHFIRGYFDGNGFTRIQEKTPTTIPAFQQYRNTVLQSGFNGSIQMITSIIKETKAHPFRFKKSSKRKEVYQIIGGQDFSQMLYEYLYQNATIWLESKRYDMDIICGDTNLTRGVNRLLEP